MSLLNELFKLREDEVIKPKELKLDNQVHNSLEAAKDEDSIDSQCFGLEMEDGQVVKVYVHEKDAETFEEALKKKLAEIDDIEEALDELEKDFEIIKIVWPEEDEDSEDEETPENEDSDDDALNPNVDYSDTEDLNAPDNFSNDDSVSFGKGQIAAKESYGQRIAKKLLAELKMDSLHDEDDTSTDEDDEDEDAKAEPESHKINSKLDVGKDSDWVVEKTDEDGLILSNKHFKAEFSPNETLMLINKIADRQVARFKNDIGKIVYVFSPRGNDYILKTPDFQTGFKIPKTIVDKILD